MKTVIEMAREAGLPLAWVSATGVVQWDQLERFAELVRADAIAEEREACATLVENMDGCSQYFPHVPEYIRARGQA